MKYFILIFSFLISTPVFAEDTTETPSTPSGETTGDTTQPTDEKGRFQVFINESSDSKVPVAIPDFVTDSGGQTELSQNITDLVRADFKLTHLFKVLDEKSFVGEDSGKEVDFSKWAAIDAAYLLKGEVNAGGSNATIEFRFYSTQSQKLVFGKRYTVKQKNYDEAVHKFMDQLLEEVTGKEGPFQSYITAACGGRGRRQITVFTMDGSRSFQVTKNKANNISPNFSPDGEVVFISFIKRYPDVFKVGLDGKKMKQLTNFGVTTITPSFSPSGHRIIFASSLSGDTELYVMGGTGKSAKKITNTPNIDLSPTWSPDGMKIIFASERAGNLHLFLMDADGGAAKRLTYVGVQNDQPDWSPDGSKVVFTSRDSGVFDVFKMNPDGSTIERLTQADGSNESPTWSPDSRYIVFSSTRKGGTGLYVMNAEGENQTMIEGSEGCINPDWGPQIK